MASPLKIAFLASEAVPFVKSGGSPMLSALCPSILARVVTMSSLFCRNTRRSMPAAGRLNRT